MRYMHQLNVWPKFTWKHERFAALLGVLRNRQGRLMGRMEAMGFPLRAEALLRTLTLDVLKSSEIEGDILGDIEAEGDNDGLGDGETEGLTDGDFEGLTDGLTEGEMDALTLTSVIVHCG